MANGRGWRASGLAGFACAQSSNPPSTSPPLLENQMAQELTQERLKELLHYDPETGVFTWKVARRGTSAGTLAGCTMPRGYRVIMIDGALCYAHRLAYLYVYGETPEGMLDHRDQDKGNNRFSNLRVTTDSQNKLNTGPRATNTSGFKGVYWNKRVRKWAAEIKIDHKKHFLGYFDNILDAVAARKEAEIALGVSEFCPQ